MAGLTKWIPRLPTAATEEALAEKEGADGLPTLATMRYSVVPTEAGFEGYIGRIEIPELEQVDRIAQITVADANFILNGILRESGAPPNPERLRTLFRERCLIQLACTELYPRAVAAYGEGRAEDMMNLLAGGTTAFDSAEVAYQIFDDIIGLIQGTPLRLQLLPEDNS